MRLTTMHSRVGYLSPKDQPGCRNCTHLTDATPENGIDLPPRPYCSKHSIEVTSGAICRDHKLQPSPSRGIFDLSFQARQLDLLRQVERDLPKSGNSLQLQARRKS